MLEEGAKKWRQRHHPWFQWPRDPLLYPHPCRQTTSWEGILQRGWESVLPGGLPGESKLCPGWCLGWEQGQGPSWVSWRPEARKWMLAGQRVPLCHITSWILCPPPSTPGSSKRLTSVASVDTSSWRWWEPPPGSWSPSDMRGVWGPHPFTCWRPARGSEPACLLGAVLSLPPALTLQCLLPPDPAGPWEVLPPRLLPMLGMQWVPGRGAFHCGRGEQHLLCQRLSHVSSRRCGAVWPPWFLASPGSIFPACLSVFSILGLFTSCLHSVLSGWGEARISAWSHLSRSSLPLAFAYSPFLLGVWTLRCPTLCVSAPKARLGLFCLEGELGVSAESFSCLSGTHVTRQSILPCCGSRLRSQTSGHVLLPCMGVVLGIGSW